MEEIDYMSMSLEELKQQLTEYQKKSSDFYNTEQGIKLTLNSIYGATGNQYFALFNPDVAESVTLQGQDIWKFAEKIINRYFNDMWHLDTELHEKMGVRNVRKITLDFIIYGDTDSNYINLGAVMDSCEFDSDLEPFEFVKRLNEFRLKEYIKKCYDIYSEKWGTDNYQDFELESLSYAGIFLGKKKYVLHIAWQDPNTDLFPRLSKVKSTGIELAQGGTAPFAREKLTFLLQHIFERGKNFDIREFVKILKNIKSEFKVQSPDQISVGTSVNNIEKFIVNDTTKFEVAKGCPMHVRAAGYHNFLLNNSKHKVKYSLIRS
jgi:DNA polymerase elongation subunit (family B)